MMPLPAFTWPSHSSFLDDDEYGHLSHDMSFIIEVRWKDLLYLRMIDNLPCSQKYKCGSTKSGMIEVKPKFGMYYRVLCHKKCGIPVTTLGVIQGGIHAEGVRIIYAQDVKDITGISGGLQPRLVLGVTRHSQTVNQP